VRHRVLHHLDTATARRVADRAWETYKVRFPRYEPEIRWLDDRRARLSFSARGLRVTGSLELSTGCIELDVKVPVALRLFKGRAMALIEEEMRRWIARAEAGDL